MLEENRNFHNGSDDPRPSGCQDQPGSTKQTQAQQKHGLPQEILCQPSSGGPGCVGGSGYHIPMTGQTLCPEPCIPPAFHVHSSLQGRELVLTEPMRTDRCAKRDKAPKMALW